MEHTPSVYIACLASYNNGILHGSWITLDGSHDVEEAITEVLQTSPIADAEEWAVHDHEYCGELSEYAGISTLSSLQEAYTYCVTNGISWALFCEFCKHLGEPVGQELLVKFQEACAGSSDSLELWAEQFLADTGSLEQIPQNLQYYFDFKAYARDLTFSDVFSIEHDNQVHVFWNH